MPPTHMTVEQMFRSNRGIVDWMRQSVCSDPAYSHMPWTGVMSKREARTMVELCNECPVLTQCGELVWQMRKSGMPTPGVWAGAVYSTPLLNDDQALTVRAANADVAKKAAEDNGRSVWTNPYHKWEDDVTRTVSDVELIKLRAEIAAEVLSDAVVLTKRAMSEEVAREALALAVEVITSAQRLRTCLEQQKEHDA